MGGGCGDREGRELSDICEAEREEGKDDRDARWFTGPAWPLGIDVLLFVRAKCGKFPWIEVILYSSEAESHREWRACVKGW